MALVLHNVKRNYLSSRLINKTCITINNRLRLIYSITYQFSCLYNSHMPSYICSIVHVEKCSNMPTFSFSPLPKETCSSTLKSEFISMYLSTMSIHEYSKQLLNPFLFYYFNTSTLLLSISYITWYMSYNKRYNTICETVMMQFLSRTKKINFRYVI